MEAERRGGASHPPRLERRALERDRARVFADLGVLSAEDPRDPERTLFVRDHERALGQDTLDVVQRADRFVATRRTSDQDAAAQLPMVVRMERLSQLEHHVVGDIHDVVDRPHARRDEARLHPGRRRTEPHAREESGREARARRVVLDT